MTDERKREIQSICEEIGYGRVMQMVSEIWLRIDPIGAFTIGPCAGAADSTRSTEREAMNEGLEYWVLHDEHGEVIASHSLRGVFHPKDVVRIVVDKVTLAAKDAEIGNYRTAAESDFERQRKLEADLKASREECGKMREALEFYADPSSWSSTNGTLNTISSDMMGTWVGGKTARKALAETGD